MQIIKLDKFYLIWSSIVDAPTTYGMTLEELEDFCRREWGEAAKILLPTLLSRTDACGTSILWHRNVDDTILCNRAGPNETSITMQQIYRAYCLRQPIEGWLP